MILADTSVWIDYLDNALSQGVVVMGDLIMLEILQGFRSDRDYNQAKMALGKLEQYRLFDETMTEICAANYRGLRRKGVTIRKTVDVIIASFCIHHHIPLLYSDKDFVPFEQHLELRNVLLN